MQKHKGKEVDIMMDLKTASPQEIAKYFSYEVNNMFFKPDKIAEE